MEAITEASRKLADRTREELEALVIACSEGHARMCAVASEDQDLHASREKMRARVAAMSTQELADALAPYAVLGQALHEHHAEHDASHH